MPIKLFRNHRSALMIFTAIVIALGLLAQSASAATGQKATHIYRTDLGNAAPALDIYTNRTLENAPVMVYVHGGAWVAGDKARVFAKPRHFIKNGFVFVSVNYRLVPMVTVQDQLTDIDYALEWVRKNIHNFGGNPENIHLMGHSTGAHLVSMTAVHPQKFTRAMILRGDIRSVISNDTRGYDIPRLAANTPSGALPNDYRLPFTNSHSNWVALSPATHISTAKRIPPFLILHSGQGNPDTRHEFSTRFASALKSHGTRVTLVDARQYSHKEINQGIGKFPDITRAIDRFLRPLR